MFKANILETNSISYGIISKDMHGGVRMGKRKKDPSTLGLSSPQVEGQGTSTTETGDRSVSSARKKQKQHSN